MSIEFIKLNNDWNAEPNAPEANVSVLGSDLILEFTVNPWIYAGFEEDERAQLIFKSFSKYRRGSTNDEGWYFGHCRFGKLAPAWGEFYQIEGNSPQVKEATDWVVRAIAVSKNHYLFYLRDNTFECLADSFEFRRVGS
jgi:hypothetical protein